MFTKQWPTGLTDLVDIIKGLKLATLDTFVSRAIDGTGGGTYSPTTKIDITAAGGSGLGDVDEVGTFTLKSGSLLTSASGAFIKFIAGSILDLPLSPTAIPDDNSDVDPANGQIRLCTVPTAQQDHHLTASGNRGRWVLFVRPPTGNFSIIFHRPGSAAAIVTLPGNTWAFAFMFDDGTNWRLGMTNGTPGAEA